MRKFNLVWTWWEKPNKVTSRRDVTAGIGNVPSKPVLCFESLVSSVCAWASRVWSLRGRSSSRAEPLRVIPAPSPHGSLPCIASHVWTSLYHMFLLLPHLPSHEVLKLPYCWDIISPSSLWLFSYLVTVGRKVSDKQPHLGEPQSEGTDTYRGAPSSLIQERMLAFLELINVSFSPSKNSNKKYETYFKKRYIKCVYSVW